MKFKKNKKRYGYNKKKRKYNEKRKRKKIHLLLMSRYQKKKYNFLRDIKLFSLIYKYLHNNFVGKQHMSLLLCKYLHKLLFLKKRTPIR